MLFDRRERAPLALGLGLGLGSNNVCPTDASESGVPKRNGNFFSLEDDDDDDDDDDGVTMFCLFNFSLSVGLGQGHLILMGLLQVVYAGEPPNRTSFVPVIKCNVIYSNNNSVNLCLCLNLNCDSQTWIIGEKGVIHG